ncbi:MAG: KH domain-containing protein [Dehalococcoidales bacterium]|nr:KH domain-containing protein [Dehalococcoidales bacterium]
MSGNSSEIYDAAKQVLEELLALMDLKGAVLPSDEFTVSDENGELSSVGLNIEGEDLGILIGRRGQTMVSLQYIVRIIMSQKMEVNIPIVLDVEGYKQRRCEGLRMLANRLAEQVKTRKTPFAMEPLPAFERRIIHLALADHPDVITESTGVGDARKVVITPKTLPEN